MSAIDILPPTWFAALPLPAVALESGEKHPGFVATPAGEVAR
jgi:hypothetical protein